MSNNFEPLRKKIQEIEKFLTSNKPLRIIKIEGLNHFQKSFTNQGFTDKTLEKWPDRKPPKHLQQSDDEIANPKKNKKPGKMSPLQKWKAADAARAILVGHASRSTGVHLKDSIQGEIGANSVIFSLDKIYAGVHNEGLESGRPPGFMMLQRQYIGQSQVLEENIRSKFLKEINKILETSIK